MTYYMNEVAQIHVYLLLNPYEKLCLCIISFTIMSMVMICNYILYCLILAEFTRLNMYFTWKCKSGFLSITFTFVFVYILLYFGPVAYIT